ncbi:MAG: type I polyketide synthase, partial [Archangium sp.]
MTHQDTSVSEEHLSSIAIIGMAGRFPGAGDVETYWRNLAAGIESISPLSDGELQRAGVSETLLRDPHYVKAASTLEGADLFDAGFFGFTPMEASLLDPQHRLLLECTQTLFDHAGYVPERLTARTGVYVGVGFPHYLLRNVWTRPDLVEAMGWQKVFFASDKDFAPTRLSHHFNLTGPSVGVDTACSTSLVAIHQACKALLSYECDMAVAGGATVLPSGMGYLYQEGGIVSPDGHCRAFDARAGGTLFGSGVGLVLLKRLSEALEDRDHVLAVIRGSSVNNDGSAKAGFTAPSVTGQAAVISEALGLADVSPESISYVEAHGTGTLIGDPIEVAGLTRAFRTGTQRKGYCALGSVKTNLGHLDVAAGVAGLLKVVQALRHQKLPPSLHFEQPNPRIDFANSPFYVNSRLSDWRTSGGPRRAGVSSFGIGGTNAHVVLEEAPEREHDTESSRPAQLLVLSARSASAVRQGCEELARHLEQAPDTSLADAASTLHLGRRTFAHRRAVVCTDTEEAVRRLRGEKPERLLAATAGDRPRVCFLLPGQGVQHPHMAEGLYATEPVFRVELDRCAELLLPALGMDLRQVLYPAAGTEERARVLLNETRLTQPALFAVSYAMA